MWNTVLTCGIYHYTIVQTEVQWNFKSNFWSLHRNFLPISERQKLAITDHRSNIFGQKTPILVTTTLISGRNRVTEIYLLKYQLALFERQ